MMGIVVETTSFLFPVRAIKTTDTGPDSTRVVKDNHKPDN
jgi:hypothetical protein